MINTTPIRVKTISEYHRLFELPKPEHPLISVINLESLKHYPFDDAVNLVYNFYCIALKRNSGIVYKYGQKEYDFDEGIMFFMSPGQVFSVEVNRDETVKSVGWLIFFHPDFLWNTPLAKTIKQYEYFNYSVNEALCLSVKEEKIIINVIKNIQQEYCSNIDKFSQNVIIAQLELLLTYAERFYHRQFLTRKKANHQILERFENFLSKYFNEESAATKGLPSVQNIGKALNISPGYLSVMLKVLTGKNAQQHIHDSLIEKAKEKLSTTDSSVSEIAYELGFEHPQSFSKLFKTITNFSPLEFRHSFN